MDECDSHGKTTRDAFLNASLSDFRYERNNVSNEFRLYHCTKEGTNRFALYFGCHKKTNDGPWLIDVLINEVDVHPNRVVVHAVDEKLQRHIVPDVVLDPLQREVLQKVCAILEAHPVSKSVVP